MGFRFSALWSTLINGIGWERSKTVGTIWSGENETKNIASGDEGQNVRICFRNLTNATTLLCWVDEDGTLHHFYQLQPYKGKQTSVKPFDIFLESDDDHVETTCCGHVFLVARSNDVEGCAEATSLESATVLGAYRADRILPVGLHDSFDIDEDHVVHLVTISDTPTHNNLNPVQSHLNRLRGCCRPLSHGVRDSNSYDDFNDVTLSVYPVVVDPTPLDSTYKKYDACKLGSFRWPVFAQPNCLDDDDDFRVSFESDLDCAISYLPEHCRLKLRDELPTPIWINRNLSYGPKACPVDGRGMCFHPEKDWLVRNGMHPEKCQSIELYSTECYKESRSLWGCGGSLLHELSHAYHFKCLESGYDNKDVLECYKAAMKEGLYDDVRVKGPQGPTSKAYACENAMEYFAELSTAFLGGIPRTTESDENVEEEFNKWYPFNREQIKSHDPRAYTMLTKLWGLSEVHNSLKASR